MQRITCVNSFFISTIVIVTEARKAEWTARVMYTNLVLNVVVHWSTVLLRIRNVPGSNLDSETGYPD
jgi:hypothetical protein